MTTVGSLKQIVSEILFTN